VAKEIGVDNRVYFLGARSDVANLIAESYIGIQSSNWEGFGLTAVEMMACGKPVIATDVDGLKQVVEWAGELFHKGDKNELAHKVKALLSDKSYYNDMALRCKSRASEYDIRVMADKYLGVYRIL
jgi:glycosyltransferase involved in cell wall biosynthesis